MITKKLFSNITFATIVANLFIVFTFSGSLASNISTLITGLFYFTDSAWDWKVKLGGLSVWFYVLGGFIGMFMIIISLIQLAGRMC